MHGAAARPRVLFLDDNLRDVGGHYLELASLLVDGARELGLQPELVAHQSLGNRRQQLQQDGRLERVPLHCEFDVRRMENWSLGVDGDSLLQRDSDGKAIGGSLIEKVLQQGKELTCRRQKRPESMIDAWAKTFSKAVVRFRPSERDSIVINTAGDFQMLALVRAIKAVESALPGVALNIHSIFHFAVYQGTIDDRARLFGRQINACRRQLTRHTIRLHATTDALANQMRAVGVDVTAIPYPTRNRCLASTDDSIDQPLKVVLPGIPRAEKGRRHLCDLLRSVEADPLISDQVRWSMQLPKKRWQRFVPNSMRHWVTQGSNTSSLTNPLEIHWGNLQSDDYHAWLDSADVALLLYDPQRYHARCSGVLLEMLARGIPSIVPDGCWMADKLRDVATTNQGRRTPIGWIYQSVDQIPEILSRLTKELPAVANNCREQCQTVREQHSGRNTLSEMGIADVSQTSHRLAG